MYPSHDLPITDLMGFPLNCVALLGAECYSFKFKCRLAIANGQKSIWSTATH